MREKCLSIIENSHYPFQNIINDLHHNQKNVNFLEVMFDFETVALNIEELSFDGACLKKLPLERSNDVTKFDMSLTFSYNPKSEVDPLSCRLLCSQDLFDAQTVSSVTSRFAHFVAQIVLPKLNDSQNNSSCVPIRKLSLMLPEEVECIKNIMFCRQSAWINEGMLFHEYSTFFHIS